MDKQKEQSRFEKYFVKTVTIASWILCIPFYYCLYMLIFGR